MDLSLNRRITSGLPLSFLWQSKPRNKKTGAIPTAYVGFSYDEALDSCSGCPLLSTHKGGTGEKTRCYAHAGSVKMGMMSMTNAATGEPRKSAEGSDAVLPGGRYSLEHAMDVARSDKRKKKPRAARLGAIGDPSRVGKEEFHKTVKTIRGNGLSVLGYTHFHREYKNRGLKRDLMASCDTLAQADDAVSRGWVPAAILPADTQETVVRSDAGNRMLICPAQRSKRVTCDDCRLCDPSGKFWERERAKDDGVRGIGFIDHGPDTRSKK